MELGNMFFGNSRGEFSIPRFVGYEDHIERLVDVSTKTGYSPLGRRMIEEGFENETFAIRPYYWGDDDAIAELPNFHFKPSDYRVKWYKYPLRDSYQNQELTVEQFGKIIDACIESVKRTA